MPNLTVLGPSRAKPRVGDVFAMRVGADGPYVFGRVVRTDALIGPISGMFLLYVYRATSSTMDPPPRDALRPPALLVPPVLTNRLGWSRGYFKTVANWPLDAADLLPQHCFRRSNGQYFDEYNHELPGPVEPVGDWAVDSYLTIDDAVSEALGIPPAPA